MHLDYPTRLNCLVSAAFPIKDDKDITERVVHTAMMMMSRKFNYPVEVPISYIVYTSKGEMRSVWNIYVECIRTLSATGAFPDQELASKNFRQIDCLASCYSFVGYFVD